MAEVNKFKLAFYLIGSMLLITFVFYSYQICYTPNILIEEEDHAFVIRPGATFATVQVQLYDNHFVNDMVSFSFLARLYGYDKAIKPGRYILACLIPARDGRMHTEKGMVKMITVK